jgi:Tfp pilus assembly protein PilN
MKFAVKTALGVDFSEGRINLAMLGQNAEGIELLKAASCPVPDGAIKDGNIEDPIIVSKVLKELRTRNKIPRTNHTGISLLTSPTVLQIIDIPKGIMSNIGHLVRNEVKSFVALSGKEVAFDFCRMTSGRERGTHLLTVATDGQRVATLIDTCRRGGIHAEVIEPPLLAYVRAIHAKTIQEKINCNVLIALLRDSVLTLCVFKKQNLDFVRTRNINRKTIEPNELTYWLAGEINAIIQFYDVEIRDSSVKWETTIIVDPPLLSDDVEQQLRDKITRSDLQVRSYENIFHDTFVTKGNSSPKASAIAIGLAMRLLNINEHNLKINLLPPESAEVRSTKKHFLITSNIIAAILLLMILIGVGVGVLAHNVNEEVVLKKQTELSQDTYDLLREQEFLDKQIEQLSGGPTRLKSILDSHYSRDWCAILEDVRNRTPQTVRITQLLSNDNENMYLGGLALSYETVHLFVKMLNESDYIRSASLNETEREETTEGLVKYVITCSLTQDKKD